LMRWPEESAARVVDGELLSAILPRSE